MFSAYELFGFMPATLSTEILEKSFSTNKELYRATLGAVAEARRVRPMFLERKPRVDRHKDMIDMLSRPRMNVAAASLIRGWLMTNEKAMLVDFLDALGLEHKDGAVDNLPETVEDEKLKSAVESLLSKHPKEKVTVYLHAFDEMNEVQWGNLKGVLESDARLQLGA
jgi:hypothetical protein